MGREDATLLIRGRRRPQQFQRETAARSQRREVAHGPTHHGESRARKKRVRVATSEESQARLLEAPKVPASVALIGQPWPI